MCHKRLSDSEWTKLEKMLVFDLCLDELFAIVEERMRKTNGMEFVHPSRALTVASMSIAQLGSIYQWMPVGRNFKGNGQHYVQVVGLQKTR